MKEDKSLNLINMVFPCLGMGLMICYDVCDTSCSHLQGTFLGADLKIVGILFMTLLLTIALPPVRRYASLINHLRTLMLSGAMGCEILLVRFQIIHDIYCPFCLPFGLCILVLFAANVFRMNKPLAAVSFLAGMGVFALFFKGSVMLLYSLLSILYS